MESEEKVTRQMYEELTAEISKKIGKGKEELEKVFRCEDLRKILKRNKWVIIDDNR